MRACLLRRHCPSRLCCRSRRRRPGARRGTSSVAQLAWRGVARCRCFGALRRRAAPWRPHAATCVLLLRLLLTGTDAQPRALQATSDNAARRIDRHVNDLSLHRCSSPLRSRRSAGRVDVRALSLASLRTRRRGVAGEATLSALSARAAALLAACGRLGALGTYTCHGAATQL